MQSVKIQISKTEKLTLLLALIYSDDRIIDQKTDIIKVLVVIARGKTLDA